MVGKPDDLDLQILAELDLNARTTTAEIGRRLDLSQNSVNSRIRYLGEIGAIKKHAPIIDYFALGYRSFRFCFRLQHTNNTLEQQMLDYLKDSHYIRWVGFSENGFGVDCVSWFRTKEQLNEFWNDVRKRFKPYIKESEVMVCSSEVRSGVPVTKAINPQAGNDIEIGTGKPLSIDETDRDILKILSANARASYSDMAKKIGFTPAAVKYRIDQLVSRKVIAGFRPLVDLRKLGYVMYKTEFDLNSLERIKELEQFIVRRSNTHMLIRNVGSDDLEVIIQAKSKKDLYSTLQKIKDEFSEDIRDYRFITYSCAFKEEFLPEF